MIKRNQELIIYKIYNYITQTLLITGIAVYEAAKNKKETFYFLLFYLSVWCVMVRENFGQL